MGLFSKFIATIKGTNDFSPADWAELEQELLASDLGPTLTKNFLEAAKKVKSDNAELALIEILTSNLSKNSHEPVVVSGTTTIMVVGVNGTGKTTSVAKLASYYKKNGKTYYRKKCEVCLKHGVSHGIPKWKQRGYVKNISRRPRHILQIISRGIRQGRGCESSSSSYLICSRSIRVPCVICSA